VLQINQLLLLSDGVARHDGLASARQLLGQVQQQSLEIRLHLLQPRQSRLHLSLAGLRRRET
jgi:hypothetical protein